MNSREEWYDSCIELQKAGNLDEAIDSLLKLVEAHPDYALPELALSVFYSKKDDFEAAIDHGKKYCDLNPEDTFGYTSLSYIAIKGGMRNEAEDALLKANNARMAAHLKGENF